MFATVALKHIRKYIPQKYETVLGPLWIRGLEWIEWDGAIIRRCAEQIFEKYYNPDDVIALFELKSGGIYGGSETIQNVISGIKGNFQEAKKVCPNLKRCFYITLHERKPKRKGSINFYGETKKLEPEIIVCVLFDSASIETETPTPPR